VAPDHAFVSIEAGWSHRCGLTATHEAYCWGDNDVGELGDGTTTASDVPVRVAIAEGVRLLSEGAPTCAVGASGTLYCWGYNDVGQVGQPVRVDAWPTMR
jgi:alpha-tubulin suppressor-like RCC1 family protein